LRGVLAPELAGLPEDCLIAPLGVAATKAVLFAADHLPALDRDRILIGLPHPAGTARDVSSQFLGNPANPKRKSPLNPEYRETALRLRAQVLKCSSWPKHANRSTRTIKTLGCRLRSRSSNEESFTGSAKVRLRDARQFIAYAM
jgi:hypothetical protein